MPSVYEIITEKIIKQLESGVAPWRKPWTCQTPANLAHAKRVSRPQCLYSCLAGVSITILAYLQSGNEAGRENSQGREVFPRHLLERRRRARDDHARRHERDLAAFSAPLLQRVQFVADGRDRHPRIPSAGDAHQRSHRNVRTNRDKHAEPASVRAIRQSVVLAEQRRGRYASTRPLSFIGRILRH